jgi:hypothetical protein
VSRAAEPAVLQHPLLVMSYLDVPGFSVAPEPMHQVLAFLFHHHPKGMRLTGNGTLGGRSYLVHEVGYSPRRLPAAFTEIGMIVQILPGRHGHTWVRTDVQLVWYPRRSAAEHLAADHFTSVTVDAFGYGQSGGHERRTFRQRAIIDKLIRALNSAPASPGGTMFCPIIMETYALTFAPAHGQAGVSVQVPGCFQYVIKIGGRDQRPLADTGQVEKIAHALMGPMS